MMLRPIPARGKFPYPMRTVAEVLRDSRVVELYGRGYGTEQISACVGLTAKAVRRVLRGNGVKMAKGPRA